MDPSRSAEIPVVVCETCGHKRVVDELDPFRVPGVLLCARCLGREHHEETVAGTGTVRTFTWYLEAIAPECRPVPYNVALVELDCGLRVIAGVEDVNVDDLAIGRRVFATFRKENEADVLRFV